MTSDRLEHIRRANRALIGDGDLDAVGEFFAADYVVHADGKSHRGHRFVRGFVSKLREALPDVGMVEVDELLSSGDSVTWRRVLRGTHEAELTGLPPSGRRVTWREMVVSRFEGGKIAEEWLVSDLAAQLLLALPRP